MLHGLHAGFYLTLWFTGLLLILQRTLDTAWFSIPNLSSLHRKFGILLVILLIQALILSIMAPAVRVFWKTVGDAIRWGIKDIVWLLKMPFHILFPKIKLPPSGRYNPGQKLNILVVLAGVTGLCVSGVWMILIPGALAAWIVHVACFLLGSIMLGAHLYLALINPPTRQALRAMIDGTVSLDYVQRHHPLSLIPPADPVPAHHVDRLPLVLTGIFIVVALIAGIWAYGAQSLFDRSQFWFQSGGMVSLEPGPLTTSHAREIPTEDCWMCHEEFGQPQSRPCLECHAVIGNRMQKKLGYHGKLSGDCIDCHTEHQGRNADIRPLDRAAFNHRQADFPLEGAHASLHCPACHLEKSPVKTGGVKQFHFIGIEHSACTSCHTDPHQDSRSSDCLKCHTLQSWGRSELTFDHNRDSRFVLQGKHAKVACDKCHPKTPTNSTPLRLYDLGTGCKECHKDPHQGQFQSSCEHCHSEKGFKDLNRNQFHGPDSKFPLRGEHAKTACIKCHTPPEKQKLAAAKFVGLDMQCQSCHKDPHNGQFQPSCEHCHSEQTWRLANPSVFHTPASKFPLQGKHAGVDCSKCHIPPTENAKLAAAKFTGLDSQCQSCHKDPHAGQMSHSCSTCHTEQDWEGPSLRFAHNMHSAFRLDAVHAMVSCDQCHPRSPRPVRYRPIEHECQSCHAVQWQAMQGKSQALQKTVSPDPHFERVGCNDCHDNSRSRQSSESYAARCAVCHNPDYVDLYYEWSRALNEETMKRKQQDDKTTASVRQIGFHNLELVRSIPPR
jgi:cytochrome b subunit of formate dehydrogenase